VTANAPGGPPHEPELTQIRAVRDAAIGVLDAHLEQVPGSPVDVETLHAAWPEALRGTTPSSRLPLTWATSAPGPALTLAVLDLLQRDALDRLRRCDGPGCGWLFLDHTRNRSRRWCDPADCGNRARVRAYAERRRQAGPVG
jgi:predicted RNA-binding Zn ribbon-like protein